ncbi:MAG: hypothetical protein ABIZ04_09340 [Opitutus sp.]
MKAPSTSRIQPRAVRAEHPLEWLAEPLLNEPTFVLKSWFGGRTLMLEGQHQLFLTMQGEPWSGVLVCTYVEHQPSLIAEIPSLSPHPILRKWLYLPETAETFERDAKRLVQQIKARDPRIGVLPSRKKRTAGRKIRFGDKL